MVTRPVDGCTRSTRPAPFSTTSSDPSGCRSIEVGQVKVSGFGAGARTVIVPRFDVEPAAFALSVQRPADGKTRRARYVPWPPVARTLSFRGPAAETRTTPANERGRAVSVAVHARPAMTEEGFAAREMRTGTAAPAAQAVARSTAPAMTSLVMAIATPGSRRRLQRFFPSGAARGPPRTAT